MPYESPIEIITRQMDGIAHQITEQRDNQIMATIREQYAVNVDKGELMRALAYDRDQYNKGYRDGYEATCGRLNKIEEICKDAFSNPDTQDINLYRAQALANIYALFLYPQE